jgi:hypothetical protein
VGFTIGGLSMITRCPRTVAQDDAIRPVMHDNDDALCLDGRRLVLVGQAAGVHEYRTLPDTFVKVLAKFPAGWDANRGPQSFSVFTKEGLTLEYGGMVDGRVVNPQSVVRAWWMTKMLDRSSDFIEYQYHQDTGISNGNSYTAEIILKKIRYTGHEDSGLAPSREIVFDYEAKTPRTFFSHGMALKNSRHLFRIQILGPGSALSRKYNIHCLR